jgi:flagellar hook-associated protein 1 FlgK
MSEFASLNTAVSGLMAHRRAMETIGHNIANVNTQGYSRQRVDLRATGGAVPSAWARSNLGGTGVEAGALIRIRDKFMEERALAEHATGRHLQRMETVVRRIELSFPEPSDSALGAQLQDFWAGWDDLANNPDSLGVRAQVLERARTLSTTFNRSAAELEVARSTNLTEAEAMLAEVNGYAASIADLNDRIRTATIAGLDPANLLDQRDLAVLNLSKIVGVTQRESEYGMVDISVGGTALVRGGEGEQLLLAPTTATPGSDAANAGFSKVELRWAKDGYPADATNGELAALLQAANETAPKYLGRLNEIARTLATAVNTVHTGNFDLNGAAGTALFAFSPGVAPAPGDPAAGWARSLSVAFSDPNLVAASNDAAQRLDGSGASDMARLAELPTSADAMYRRLIGELGVEAQTMERRSEIQAEIVRQVDDERQAASGVNLDEEMANLVMTQQAYNASARLLAVVDEMLDTLINRTGIG